MFYVILMEILQKEDSCVNQEENYCANTDCLSNLVGSGVRRDIFFKGTSKVCRVCGYAVGCREDSSARVLHSISQEYVERENV